MPLLISICKNQYDYPYVPQDYNHRLRQAQPPKIPKEAELVEAGDN
jgi:hypothetical protein